VPQLPLLRYALREIRGGARTLVFFVLCLAVGVAAVVAVHGLSSGIAAGVRAQARELLGADAVVQAWKPLPELEAVLGEAGVEVTHVKEMVTLVARESEAGAGRSQLVELKVVDAVYPFYGPPRLDPDRPLRELLTAEATVVADDLLDRLGLDVGGTLRIGGRDFRIAGRVLAEADAVSGALRLGPRVFLSHAGLARTSLEAFGSRILRRALLRVPPGADPDRIVTGLRERFKDRDDLRIETYREIQPAVQRTMRRMEPYLALVALVSLLLGGIGVGQGVRVWIRGRLDSIAVLKALGVRPREALALYLGQTLALGLAGSGIGIAVGLALTALLPRLVGDALPPGLLRTTLLAPALHGVAVGLAVAALFSIGPLLAVVRVPPSRVFRRDAEPLPFPRVMRLAGSAAVLLLVTTVAALESRSWTRGAAFAVGVAAIVVILAVAARLLARSAAALGRRGGPLAARYGAASLARPGADTLGAVTALGLGLAVVVALSTVERHLSRDLAGDLPVDAPTAFFVDIQPDQWSGVDALMRGAGAERIDSVPVVTARLRAIDGRRALDIARERAPDRRWSLTREQRLTYLSALPRGNTLVEGALWSDPARGEISLEHEFARSLDVRIGSTMTFDVQGVPVDLAVTSLRRVDWRTFGINFFAVVEPGVLDAAPQMRLAAARIPPDTEPGLQDRVAAAYPNVTVVLIRDILEKVSAVVGKLAVGVQLLGGFTFVTGLGILAAAFHVAAQRRRREVALLKTIGFTRAQVLLSFAVEYALIGGAAGLIGAAAGSILGWAVVAQILELEWSFALRPVLGAVAATVGATVVASLAATARAIRVRPATALSSEA
jgi:putative ABC transport system permease protein